MEMRNDAKTTRCGPIVALAAMLAAICLADAGCASEPDSASSPAAVAPRPAIVFFGDSLTAGLGVEPEQAYPALVQAKLDAAGLVYEAVNAGLSGETTTAGVRRIGWVLRRPNVAVVVIALGGNDGLRGVPPEETERNLAAIVDAVRERRPAAHVILAGMEAPPNMGPEFTRAFREVFPRVAHQKEVPLLPFLLEGVAGDPALNQKDGIHPTVEGQKIVANNVWIVLNSILREPDSG